ncbi:DASH complex subunit ask1 [Ascosphaera acerosa]|nr:DASH complex subunit ask1 [Ascosphaera acerosa]
MAQLTSHAHRTLTLTEELERLEQQITLTLQEIDSNFSRAHRIVTTSILPIVDQHAEQSRRVWEGARFWKQFFEASANVSLSGYEEGRSAAETPAQRPERESDDVDGSTGDTSIDLSRADGNEAGDGESYPHATAAEGAQHDDWNASALSVSPSRSSTPRPATCARVKAEEEAGEEAPLTPMDYTSPYEQMRMDLHLDETPVKTPAQQRQRQGYGHPTPGRPHPGDVSSTPASPPWPGVGGKQTQTQDPILHRVLNKTYRIQSTPVVASRVLPPRDYGASVSSAAAKGKARDQAPAAAPIAHAAVYMGSSPPSSPELEAPKLNAELFNSPLKDASNLAAMPRKSPSKRSPFKSQRDPPRPGVSVLTPMKPAGQQASWDSDGEMDDDTADATRLFGGSPPKTMQFHVPQSRLLQTPAKEATQRIMAEILSTAGGNEFTEDSITTPDMVRQTDYVDDDSF